MPDELDRLLDEALSTYTAAPERPGLEARLLARLPQRKSHLAFRWMYLAAAAAIVLGLFFLPRHPPRASSKTPAAITVPVVAPLPLAPPANLALAIAPKPSPRKRRALSRHDPLPKRPVFPTPLPLSPQEHALLEVARLRPEMLKDLNQPLRPLEIAPIIIEPLDKGINE